MTVSLECFLDELREWVAIETPSAAHAAVTALGDRVAQSCGAAGLSVERVPGTDGSCDTILARGGPNTGERGLLVLAHLDTVHPIGTLQTSLPWRRDGDRLYGPGIYDMKASALMAIEAWKQLRQHGRSPVSPVTFLFAPDEEIGSPSSRPVIENEARKAFATFVVEPARDGGKIVIGRKGVARFVVTAHGVPAHSGGNFEQGRSAISEIARQIAFLEEMTDVADGVTVNVGTIRGGTTPNTVPATCTIEVDVRMLRMDQATRLVDAIRSMRPFGRDIRLTITGELNRPPFFPDDRAHRLFEHARFVAAGCNIDLVGVHAGAASDGNFTAALGVPTLDGLGVDGAGAHTLDEHILVSTVLPRTGLFAELLATTTESATRTNAARTTH